MFAALQSAVALWYLALDSELLFVGDAGTTEPGRPSRRVGVEWSNYARVTSWLTFEGDLALTRFDADASDIDYFYTPRLRGEPVEGFDDIHTHPALPRSVRLGLHWSF